MPDAICFWKASLHTPFRYETHEVLNYWETAVSFKGRAVYTLGRFVTAHFRRGNNLTETARDCPLCRIPPFYKLLKTLQWFHFEMETLFSYQRALIEDVQSGLWVFAMTEHMLCVMASLLYKVYDDYRLWLVPPDIIQFTRKLGMAMQSCLGSTRNDNEVHELMYFLVNTQLDILDASWRCRSDKHTEYHRGRVGGGADFVYYDSFLRRKTSAVVARSPLGAILVVPVGVSYGWEHPEDEGQWVTCHPGYDYTCVVLPSVGQATGVMVVETAEGRAVVGQAGQVVVGNTRTSEAQSAVTPKWSGISLSS